MKRVLASLAFTAALAVLQPAAARAEFALQDTDRVMFFGAHSTWPASFGLQVESFVRVKYPELKTCFWHWGPAIPQRILDARRRFEDHLTSFRPTVVVINFGTEDPQLKPLQEGVRGVFYAELIAMVERCQQAGARVVLVTPNCPEVERKTQLARIEYDQVIGKYAAHVRKLATERQLALVDWYQATAELIASGKGHGGRNALTTDGVHPSPLAHAVAAEKLLEFWQAEPHQVTVHVDWQSLEASTTAGSIGATRKSESVTTVRLKDFPMPWILPGARARVPRVRPEGRFCRFTFHVHNAPPGGILTAEPGGKATPWLEQMLEGGFDMASIGPLLTTRPARTLMERIKSKNRTVDRLERFLTHQNPEPEYAEVNPKYQAAMVAEIGAQSRIIARTPRTMDVTLELKLAKPPGK